MTPRKGKAPDAACATAHAAQGAEDAARRAYAGYSGEPKPLGPYAAIVALFNVLFAGFLMLAGRGGRPLPRRIEIEDIVLLGVATHKLSRLVAKDKVTSSLRAPFARFDEKGGPSEVEEHARGRGWRRAIGELITCPYCIGLWIASCFHAGLLFRPPETRLAASVLASLTLSDFLQAAYAVATAKAEKS